MWHYARAFQAGIDRYDVNVAIVGVQLLLEGGMIRTRPKTDIVAREVAFVLEIVVYQLLKYVFFHRQSFTACSRYIR